MSCGTTTKLLPGHVFRSHKSCTLCRDKSVEQERAYDSRALRGKQLYHTDRMGRTPFARLARVLLSRLYSTTSGGLPYHESTLCTRHLGSVSQRTHQNRSTELTTSCLNRVSQLIAIYADYSKYVADKKTLDEVLAPDLPDIDPETPATPTGGVPIPVWASRFTDRLVEQRHGETAR